MINLLIKSKIILFSFICFIPLTDSCLAEIKQKEKLFKYIEPFAGNKSFDSGNRLNLGKLSPGARSPNGNILFGPISVTGGDNTSGYSFYDKWIEGFSPNIMDGTGGLGEFGNFLFIPFSSNKQVPFKRISPLTRTINLPFKKDFIKSNEKSEAAFYSVDLPEIKSKFRITADKEIGLLEINDYSKNRNKVKIFLDPTRRNYGTCKSSKISWIDRNHIGLEIKCPHNTGGWGLNPLENYKGYNIYSVIRSNNEISSISFLEESEKRIIPNQKELSFLNLERSLDLSRPLQIFKQFIKKPFYTFDAFKFYFKYYSFFGKKGELKKIKLGEIHTENRPLYLLEFNPTLDIENNKKALISISTSFISLEDAFNKYNYYSKKIDFDQIKNKSTNEWEKKLSRFRINGDLEEKKLFYTALYRALAYPRYTQFKKGNKTLNALSPFSGFDIHKSHFPFLSLFYSQVAIDQAYYLYQLSNYLPEKKLPIWSLAGQETNGMLGIPGPIVISQAINYNLNLSDEIYLKAILNSYKDILDNNIESQNNPHKKYLESIQVENATSARCILKASKKFKNALNKKQIKELSYISNIFPFKDLNNEKGIINKENLKFDEFTIESNRLQQSFSIHGSPRENISKLGGQENFYKIHNNFLEGTNKFNLGDEQNKYFRLENEIVHLAPYTLYYLDKKYRSTIEKYNELITSNFSIKPNGWPGNDDLGQLSSYFIFNALGIHPISPCDNRIAIFPPIYSEINISFKDNTKFNKKSSSIKIKKSGNQLCKYKVYIDNKDYGPYPLIHSNKLLKAKLIEHKYIC